LSTVLTLISFVGLVWAWATRRWHAGVIYALSLALALASVVALFAQMKLYQYHWSLAVAAVALGVARASVDLHERGPASIRSGSPFLLAAAVIAAFVLTGEQWRVWRDDAVLTSRYVAGRASRDEFVRRYDYVPWRRRFSELDAVGSWVRERTQPDDFIDVRGVSAEIYVIAERHAPTRFFWTAFLDDTTRAYKQAEWQREDDAALRAHPPRFIVVPPRAAQDAASRFAAMGYAPVHAVGDYRILARVE
jgi:hypothetical protein